MKAFGCGRSQALLYVAKAKEAEKKEKEAQAVEVRSEMTFKPDKAEIEKID